MSNLFNLNSLTSVINSSLIVLPSPLNLSLLWNFGSLLGLCLMVQLISGLGLAGLYKPSMDDSFFLIMEFMESTFTGSYLRFVHMNGASLFFVCLFSHIGKGLYYISSSKVSLWNSGVTLFLLVMATAFMGYVLPTNQMSFWGASVITNLFTEVPYIGSNLVTYMWGGSVINDPTVIRFYMLHFLMPFIISGLVIIHIVLLHSKGSSNMLGLKMFSNSFLFHIYYSFKDLMGVLVLLSLYLYITLNFTLLFGDNENFIMANPSVTPLHIQPEWYFLFAYAILRSIPNKLGGVIALAFSVLILYFKPFLSYNMSKATMFTPLLKMMFWVIVLVFVLLTWIGMKPVMDPYIFCGQVLTIVYFSLFMLDPIFKKIWMSN